MKLAFWLTMVALVFSVISMAQENPTASPSSARYTGKVYMVGDDVTPPRVLSGGSTEELGENALRSGKVKLDLVVDPQGDPRNIKVVKKLSPELDQKAIEIVQKWKFDPARKKGQPVAVQIQVEITNKLKP